MNSQLGVCMKIRCIVKTVFKFFTIDIVPYKYKIDSIQKLSNF